MIGKFSYKPRDLIKFIYSPEGFFAVIKAIDAVTKTSLHRALMAWFYDRNMEAFYNAIYEVMKDE